MGELTFYQWANALKGYMLALGVAFGICMIVLWWRSSQAARRHDNEVKARSVYAAYLLKAMELQDNVAAASPDPRARGRYPTFVAYLVTVADEILLLCPTPEWEAIVQAELKPHAAYLGSSAFRHTVYAGLTPQLRQLVDAAVAGLQGAAQRPRAAE